jgi:hypothetical protein
MNRQLATNLDENMNLKMLEAGSSKLDLRILNRVTEHLSAS